MLSLHEVLRDLGRKLAALSDDDFLTSLTNGLADLFQAFHVGVAEIRDYAGTRAGPVTVIATAPIEGAQISADMTAVAVYACSVLDDMSLRAAYQSIAQVKMLQKTPSDDPGRSTVTLGVIVAATSLLSLDSIAQTMRRLNTGISADLRPDMTAVLARGTINYLVTFGPDQTMPGDWLPPALGNRDFVPPVLLHMVTTATSAFSLNRLVGYIIGHLAFYAPNLERPEMRAAVIGVPTNRTVVVLYQFNLSGDLVEVQRAEAVASPPYLIESPSRELLAKMFYQPWQDGGIVILDGLLPLEGLMPFAPVTVSMMTFKLKGDRQISSVLPMSFDAFKAFGDEIARRSNLVVRPQTQEFTLAHLADEGSSTPFVARLWMTPPRLRDLVLHQSADIAAFDSIYQSILNDLMTLRRIGRETLDLWSGHVQEINSGEIIRYRNGIEVDKTIDERLVHNVETIVRTVADTAKLFQGIPRLFQTEIGFVFQKDAVFQKSVKDLEAVDYMLADYLREVRKWMQPVTLARNDLEHNAVLSPRIQYLRHAGDRFEVKEPEVLGLPLTSFIPVILSRLNRFIEEVLVRSIQAAIANPMVIAEIPIALRDPVKPERFAVGLLGQVQAWHIIYSDDAFDDV